MTTQFIWLIPLANLCIFAAVGLLFRASSLVWPHRVNRLAIHLLTALTLLPLLLVGFPRIHAIAWLVVALGLASRLVPNLERHSTGVRRLIRLSFPVVAGLVPVLAATQWGLGWARRNSARQHSNATGKLGKCRALGAGHGRRGTSQPRLWIRSPHKSGTGRIMRTWHSLRSCQATSSWTLPSHASMFTGRWPHELRSAGSIRWIKHIPRGGTPGSRGYATAGFVAIPGIATDSGLERGFSVYED